MTVMQDGVEVLILPDCAKCTLDEDQRSPLEILDCPLREEICSGDCLYYSE